MPVKTTQLSKQSKRFLTAAEHLADCVVAVEQLRAERIAAVSHLQELNSIRQRLETIDDDISRASVQLVVVERTLAAAETRRAEAMRAVDTVEPPKH